MPGLFDDIPDDPLSPAVSPVNIQPEGAPSSAQFARMPQPQEGAQSTSDSISSYIPDYLKESAKSLYEGPAERAKGLAGEFQESRLSGQTAAGVGALLDPIPAISQGTANAGSIFDLARRGLGYGEPNKYSEAEEGQKQRFVRENPETAQTIGAVMEGQLSHPYGVMGAPRDVAPIAERTGKAIAENAPDATQLNSLGGPKAKTSLGSLFADIPDEPPHDTDPLGYYSAALEAANSLKQAKGTPEQMLAQLRKGGAKDAEIATTGLDQFLADKKSVTKQDIATFLEENRVGLKEVTRSRSDAFEGLVNRKMDEWRADQLEQGTFDEKRDHWSFYDRDKPVKQAVNFLKKNGVDLPDNPDEDDFTNAEVKITSGTVGHFLDNNGQFFIVEAPNGKSLLTSEFDSNPQIFDTKKSAIEQLNYDGQDFARDSIRNNEYEVEQRFRDEDPEDDPTKWSSCSLDPNNPSYRETVLHLPPDTKAAREIWERKNAGSGQSWDDMTAADHEYLARSHSATFQSGHFPEPNITGHMMTSLVKDAEDKPVFLVDQIQSDWGQRLRDNGARDEAKISELTKRVSESKEAWQNIRDQLLADPNTRMAVYSNKLPPEAEHAKSELWRLEAELVTATRAVSGHPLVNTTSQWVTTTLRRAINQAVEAGADKIAIPSGDTVLSYNPGDKHGMNEFYNKIVPLALKKIMRGHDAAYPEPSFAEKLETPTQGAINRGKRDVEGPAKFGFTVFPLTDHIKQSVKNGQPLFSRGGRVKKPAATARAAGGKIKHHSASPYVQGLLRKYAPLN